MHSELKQFIRLAAIILSVIAIASVGLVFDSLNGLAWLLGSPLVVMGYLWFRHSRRSERYRAKN